MRTHKLEIFRAENAEHCWRLVARNGRIIAIGGETFKRPSGAFKASIGALDLQITVSLKTATDVRFERDNGDWVKVAVAA